MILNLYEDLIIQEVNKIIGYCINLKINRSVKKEFSFVVLQDNNLTYDTVEQLKEVLRKAIFARFDKAKVIFLNSKKGILYNRAINCLIDKTVSMCRVYSCNDTTYQENIEKYNAAIYRASKKMRKLSDHFINHRGVICTQGMSDDELEKVCKCVGIDIVDLKIMLENGPHDILKMMFGIMLKKSMVVYQFFESDADKQNIDSYSKIIDYIIFHERKNICKESNKIQKSKLCYHSFIILHILILASAAACMFVGSQYDIYKDILLLATMVMMGVTFIFAGLQHYFATNVIKYGDISSNKLQGATLRLWDILYVDKNDECRAMAKNCVIDNGLAIH
ncbi:hypothetical protein HL033_03340 [Neoehrlichia mikurensis]|uniref:Uncharacterized protein n=1 Tax=Neoehrlichia mikurensis TaxID=89586 RepID=A0A9Q9BVF0_9RICK|nr:hypothetical protein [Neoehrlichia mikurensis]QXK91772.1 hypothetical protein IAH97_03335 [Neoehrlichia mikurensis]QXK92985.1 hypothetical protein HUN61_03330 [Neoehrlichia mikurensis]QXK93462.1 hypothetical protein HL033_03340 [Neoehrlichia mikurensis]UTO55583.1 hypothetical protein LUA82_00605 [Neoehrlichia mikurensis]UTO56504.1 hypothetical protein LUA81_00605 [Neoehrlichia mikurensis]